MSIRSFEIKAELDKAIKKLEKAFQVLSKAEDDGDDTTDAEKEYEELQNRVRQLETRLARAEDLEASKADECEDKEDDSDDRDEKSVKRFNINKGATPDLDDRFAIGRKAVTSLLLHQKRNATAVHADLTKSFGETEATRLVKDMTSTGQPVVAQDYRGFIEMLRAKAVVRGIADSIVMPNGNLTIPRQVAGATAYWTAEGAQITSSSLNIDTINLIWKKLAAFTYATREMLQFSAFDLATKITNDLVEQTALFEDKALLTNLTTGSNQGQPMGLAGFVAGSDASNTVKSSGFDFQSISMDLLRAVSQIEGNVVDSSNLKWIMNPRVKNFLKAVSSTLGVYPFRDELNNGKLMGYDVLCTTQLPTDVPNTLATPTNTVSPIFLAAPQHLLVADAGSYQIEQTNEGSFVNSAGQQINTFGQDFTAWKLSNRIDFTVTNPNAVVQLNADGWSLGNVDALMNPTITPNTGGSLASGAKARS